MKRLLIALLLACVTGAAAYAVFMKARPENAAFDCEIKWLSHKLALTPEQTDRVRALHLKYCPTMNGLKAACARNQDSSRVRELEQACRDSSVKLVEAVSAELTPVQRENYMKLLAASKCSKEPEPSGPPK